MSTIIPFEKKQVRHAWNQTESKWHFSIDDVVSVLTGSTKVKDYIKKLRKRDHAHDAYWGTNCPLLAMPGADRKTRPIRAANAEGFAPHHPNPSPRKSRATHEPDRPFEGKRIRGAWDQATQKWLSPIVDVIAVLTDSANPTVYWRLLKTRLTDEGCETVTQCNASEMTAIGGKQRLTDVATVTRFNLGLFPGGSAANRTTETIAHKLRQN
jgi:hypothetical protein